MGDSLASLVAGLHVGDARHEPALPTTALDAQEMVLSDEDMLEGILFSIGGRVPRPNMVDVIAVSDEILTTLLSSSAVCRVWRGAAARPLLAAALDKALSKYKLLMDFYRKKRDGLIMDVGKQKPKALAIGEKELASWLISGWENGCGSVVADDVGLDSAGSCALLISFMWRNGIQGPFVIVAPEPSWPSWQDALLQLVDLRVSKARTGDELKDVSFEPRSTADLVLLSMHPAAAGLEVLADAFAELAVTFKLIIFDERQFNAPGLSARHMTINYDLISDSLIRLTHEPLPGDVSSIMQTIDDVSYNVDSIQWEQQLSAQFEKAMQRFCRGERAPLLRRWAMGHVVVPIMQTQLSGAFVMRRAARGGQPHIVEREVPEHMVVDFNKGRHWMLNLRVRVEGLKSKPEYNGRVGYVHAYDESAERLHVLLSARETEPERWIKVKDENVATVDVSSTRAAQLSARLPRP